MYCVCFQTKSSNTVQALMRDRRKNAYGVRLKSHTTKSYLFPQNFVTISSDSFEDSLKNVFSKIERRVLVPDEIMSFLLKCHEFQYLRHHHRNCRFYTPPKLCLWEGILFSCCPSVRKSDQRSDRVYVTFCFLNILKNH